jgi:integrase
MTFRPKNHPKKGSSIKVEPIRDPRDIKTIKKLLAGHPRNYCLFVLGINTALRAGDLLSITVGQVRGLKAGDHLEIREQKTGKVRRVTLNRAAVEAIGKLLESREFGEEDFLFTGQRGQLSVSYVTRLVKGWCREINLKGRYASHTLRKTFGYHQRVTHGVALPVLVELYGHATQRQTLDYLCVQDEEIKDVYMNEI